MTSIRYDEWKGGVGVPGTWHGGVKADGTRTASICCPECKKIASLTDHEIRSCGVVTPSVVCPRDGCGWHVFVQLEGWSQTPAG